MKNWIKIQPVHITGNLWKKFKTYSMKNLSQRNEYDILLEGTETPSFYAEPKPKPIKAFQHLDSM